jgi:hypothetical protein
MKPMKNPIEICPNCKDAVYFSDPLWNQCPSCGCWFNGVGQRVISPEAYQADPENTESMAEIYSDYDPEDLPGFDYDGETWE